MDNPCKTCRLSASDKAACCGCPDRLKWERELRENDLLRRCAVLMTVENMYKASDGNIEDFYDLLIECFKVLPPHVEGD